METVGGENSKAGYSAKTNEELLSLASMMYSLDEVPRSLLTDELERRSLGPDEIQSYIDAEAAKTSRPDPNSGMFAWIWPAIDDEETAKDASRRATRAAELVTFLEIILSLAGCLALLLGANGMGELLPLQLLTSIALAGVFFLVARGIRNQSRQWAGVGLIVVLAGAVLDLRRHPLARLYSWDVATFFLWAVLVIAFVSGIRGTFAYHKYVPSTSNLPHSG
jgi:hypothetical protein